MNQRAMMVQGHDTDELSHKLDEVVGNYVPSSDTEIVESIVCMGILYDESKETTRDWDHGGPWCAFLIVETTEHLPF